MKSVYLVRHAKSDWSDRHAADSQRPLNHRGQRAAAAMAVDLLQRGVKPTLVLCSSATRARETWHWLAERIGAGVPIRIEDDLYLATAPSLAHRLQAVEDDQGCVLVVGHNPGLEDLVRWLDPDAADRATLPTCAVAQLELRVEHWRDLCPGAAELVSLRLPKQLV